MAADDLRTPLGMNKAPSSRSAPAVPYGRIAAVAAGLAVFGIAGWMALVDDPLGGEPTASVRIEAPKAREVAAVRDAGPPQAAPAAPSPPAQPGFESGGVRVIYGVPPSAGQEQAATGSIGPVNLPPQADSAPAAAIGPVQDALLDRTGDGLLPRIAGDGTRPAEAYARPVVAPASTGGGSLPQIALLVGGLGLSPDATASAATRLPADVTLAFSPDGRDLDREAQRARDMGHEVMLQLPMEPEGYPANNPGPRTLLTANGEDKNLKALRSVMMRMTGYIGLVNDRGGKFTGDNAAFEPVLREIAARGLIYAEDSSVPGSKSEMLARSAGLDLTRADLVIDAAATASGIDAQLAKLEEIAKKNGSAMGSGTAMPMTIDRISEWAQGLERRGIRLVPVSALARR